MEENDEFKSFEQSPEPQARQLQDESPDYVVGNVYNEDDLSEEAFHQSAQAKSFKRSEHHSAKLSEHVSRVDSE